LFGAYIIGSLEAGIVATTISGYWVQLMEGLVMAASISLNAVLAAGNVSNFSTRIQRWFKPMRANHNGEESQKDDTVSR
jgi:hypothetical protein